MLKLYGHFSYVDKYNKMKFLYIDDETREKLQRAGYNKDKEFTVSTPHITPDIIAKVGLKCIIYVKVKSYNFTSSAQHNKGEKITGVSLILDDIQVDGIYGD